MIKPEQQAIDFVSFLLSAAPNVEFAAASYGPDGRVDKVLTARRKASSIADFVEIAPLLRHQNASGANNIWARPASAEHPVIMLDDLPVAKALAITRKYRAAAVETSLGNAQAWLICNRSLTREQRQDVARSLCKLFGSDPGAISEPRWGRLPGFRQRKPGKSGWTNLLVVATNAAPFDPTPHLAALSPAPMGAAGVFHSNVITPSLLDSIDISRREFGYALHALLAGVTTDVVEARIVAHVAATGRRKSRGYAKRTVQAALARLRQRVS